MNLNTIRQVIFYMSKKMLHAIIANCILIGTMYANNLNAQEIESVRNSTVALELENETLTNVFNIIESKTDYKFAFQVEEISKSVRISGKFNNTTVADVLMEISKQSGLRFKQINNTIHISKKTKRHKGDVIEVIIQGLTITGQVKGAEDDSGLPGVNVIVKGTSHGTVTDVEGNYALDVPDENSILQFSSVGYIQEEAVVGNRTVIDYVLTPDLTQLDEIVVIGYGTQEKVNLTGAVSVVKGEDLVNRPTVGTMEAMQGTIAGTVITRSSGAPGQEDFSIQIRGLSSVNNAPALVLIDGIEGSMNDVRPEDIESISVLKDAAASAIYGAKAAGGVVLITTKSGKAGKIIVEYNGYYSLSKTGRTNERLSSLQNANLLNLAYLNAGKSVAYSDETLAKIADPNFTWEEHPSKPNHYLWYGDYNYVDLLVDKYSPTQSHSVSISGGSDINTFRLSGIYYKRDGIINFGPDSNSKYSGRLNINTNIGKYLVLSNNFSYAHDKIEKPISKLEGRYSFFNYLYTYPGLAPTRDPRGNLLKGDAPGGRIKFYDFDSEKGVKTWDNNNLRLNSTLTFKNLVKGLQIRVIGAVDANFNNSSIEQKKLNGYGIDGSVVMRLTNYNSIERKTANSSFKELQAIADYDLEINKHRIHVLGGYSSQEYRYESWTGKQPNLINGNLPSFNWGQLEGISLKDNIRTNAFQSLFGRVAYNYDSRYLLEANFRYDGSSKLSPDNRYKFFPSASAAWRISQESWFDVSFIDELKVRGSWGQLGNAGVLGNYDYIPLLSRKDDVILDGIRQRSYVYQNTLASNNISWETLESSNIGVDVALFNSRLPITFDYFVKRNIDMLARVEFPSVIGIGVPNLNAGELKIWGWETTFGWKDNVGDWKYYINGNLSNSKNELIDYLGANVIKPGMNKLLQGYPINSIYGYKTDGYFDTQQELDAHDVFQDNRTGVGDVKYLDLNGDGILSAGSQTEEDHGDLEYLGDNSPQYTFGLQAGFSWKSLDFSLFLQGVGKRTFMVDIFGIMPFYRSYTGLQATHLDYWTPENLDAQWPRLYERGNHNYKDSDKWVQNAAYIRIKDIQLGYTLPYEIGSGIGIQKLRVYISGHDIFELTGVDDFVDPEFPNNLTYQYPFRRSLTLGLNLVF